MTYLLDTNACIAHLRSGGSSRISARINSASRGEIVVCSVVREELLFGALRSAQMQKNLTQVQGLLSVVPSVPFDDRAADASAHLRADLERRGLRIGFADAFIAAIALANLLVLVTHNTAEFSRVAGLSIEDWETTP